MIPEGLGADDFHAGPKSQNPPMQLAGLLHLGLQQVAAVFLFSNDLVWAKRCFGQMIYGPVKEAELELDLIPHWQVQFLIGDKLLKVEVGWAPGPFIQHNRSGDTV